MRAEIIPLTQPADDIVIRLGIATDNLKNTPLARISESHVEDYYGNVICGHCALKQIAAQIWLIAQAAQSYANEKKNGGAA